MITVAMVVIAVVIIAIAAFLFTVDLFPTHNTTNITNSTVNVSTANNTTVNNTTVSNQPRENNPPPPHDISPEKARELAKKYVGPGIILGKPVKTTYKRINVWQVPVYTRDHKFINNIYIDARTGKKVD
ncbi:PepSY domain-containing protein [Methanobacterium petrolearium]|uniref:PepSY domain-containing protein n=1 Tax=Methanobacterium petrolearium TaxID=710190 RepID=UPI001FD7E629|nr:PepSY domain-containing protein [Methanobacterium petrolearium]BDZ72026.1 hypothetical protein GCM10025861_25430 [Methanobacterium petrolearium]